MGFFLKNFAFAHNSFALLKEKEERARLGQKENLKTAYRKLRGRTASFGLKKGSCRKCKRETREG